MTYNPKLHHRKSIRLKGYDYAQEGLYFITICCQDRANLFGHIENGEMVLNDAGRMVEFEWMNLKNRFPQIELHEFVTMPNHFHAILEIVGATLVVAQNVVAPNDIVPQKNTVPQNDTVKNNKNIVKNEKRQPQGIAPIAKTVGDITAAFKSITTVEYIRGVKNNDWKSFNGKIWQRNYWEHIIRNDADYQRISEYIIKNPQKWEQDKLKK
jgi:putative transposase